jgi:hypothetical protein
MEHIPSFNHASEICHIVPYCGVGGWQYDGLGFAEFPQRKGIDVNRLKHGDMERRTPEENISFLQAWLFFALLHSIFAAVDIEVRSQDFIVVDVDGRRTVSTALLPRLVILWEICERGAMSDSRTKHLTKIDADVAQALDFMNESSIEAWRDGEERINSLTDSLASNDQEGNGSKILISVVLLIEALKVARHFVYRDPLKKDNSRIGGESFSSLRPLEGFDRLLQRAGWCPYDVQLLRQQDNNTCRYYLSQLDRCVSLEDHSTCTTDECALNTIPAEQYYCAHVNADCGQCEHLHSELTTESSLDFGLVGLNAVSTILKDGHIPLITVSLADDIHATRIQVISSKTSKGLASLRHQYKRATRQNHSVWAVGNSGSKPTIPYVAISHVWSGGLGNPHSNSLPKCQLARIQKFVNALYDEQLFSVPFWIDTLCVPREIEARRLAIRSMKSVYQEADRVLVLDNPLLSIRILPNPVENLMRIRSTRWLQRLWTFQEGILASSLYFQFCDWAVLGEDLVVQMEERQRKVFTEAGDRLEVMLRDRVKVSKRVLVQMRNNLNSSRPGLQNPWLGQHPQAHDLVSYRAKLMLRDLRFQNSIYTGTLLKKKN